MKAKTKPRKRQSRLTATTVVTVQQPKMSIFELLFVAGLILAIICIMFIVAHYFSSPPSSVTNETIYQPPKDIDWFYNRSSYLIYLKTRVDDLDNQTKYFISKHGTDETGYDANEKDRIASLRGGLGMLKIRYNELAAEYNSNAADMNRSWNKTLPRQIYDVP
jgi:hypothetical protein